MSADMKMPVLIITGYLGAGKTTLLNRILHHESSRDSLVVINEFGEISLDHLLVAYPSENMVEIAGGCACCTMQGELVDTLRDLYVNKIKLLGGKIKRVIIETTGLADTVPLIQTLTTDEFSAAHYELIKVITVVDGVEGLSQIDRRLETIKQIACADQIVINKADLVQAGQLDKLQAAIKGINNMAPVVRIHKNMADSELDISALMDRVRFARKALLEPDHPHPAHGADSHPAHDAEHQHLAGVASFSTYIEEPVTLDGLRLWIGLITALSSRKILRLKAIFNVAGKPVVLHIVQANVYEPEQLEDWPDADTRSRVVLIGRDLSIPDFKDSFRILGFRNTQHGSLLLDPASYDRFLSLSGNHLSI